MTDPTRELPPFTSLREMCVDCYARGVFVRQCMGHKCTAGELARCGCSIVLETLAIDMRGVYRVAVACRHRLQSRRAA